MSKTYPPCYPQFLWESSYRRANGLRLRESGMNEPIKSGDRCEVIGGALGREGPNIGKLVTVGQLRGEHSEHGRIWRCHGEGLVTEYGALGTEADFAQSWLRKLPPSEVPPEVERREEVTNG